MNINITHARYVPHGLATIKRVGYYQSGHPRIDIIGYDGDQAAVVTAYVEGLEKYDRNHVAVKTYSENAGLLKDLISNNVLVGEPVGFIKSGFVEFPVYKLCEELLS